MRKLVVKMIIPIVLTLLVCFSCANDSSNNRDLSNINQAMNTPKVLVIDWGDGIVQEISFEGQDSYLFDPKEIKTPEQFREGYRTGREPNLDADWIKGPIGYSLSGNRQDFNYLPMKFESSATVYMIMEDHRDFRSNAAELSLTEGNEDLLCSRDEWGFINQPLVINTDNKFLWLKSTVSHTLHAKLDFNSIDSENPFVLNNASYNSYTRAVLDLNGQHIKFSTYGFAAQLDTSDFYIVDYKGTGSVVSTRAVFNTARAENSRLTVENGIYSSTYDKTDTASASVIYARKGTVIVNGGELSAPNRVICATEDGNVIFNNGTVKGSGSYTVHLQGSGKVKINNGLFITQKGNGGSFGLLGNSSLEVNGGTFYSSLLTMYLTGDGSATINGGKFVSKSGIKSYSASIKISDGETVLPQEAYRNSLTINGGEFISGNDALVQYRAQGVLDINGGTFKQLSKDTSSEWYSYMDASVSKKDQYLPDGIVVFAGTATINGGDFSSFVTGPTTDDEIVVPYDNYGWVQSTWSFPFVFVEGSKSCLDYVERVPSSDYTIKKINFDPSLIGENGKLLILQNSKRLIPTFNKYYFNSDTYKFYYDNTEEDSELWYYPVYFF